MLRIRSIHYDAFKSSKLAVLSAEAERCWWRLQCVCDDDGRCEDDPEVIASLLFLKRRDITPEQVDRWLGEMADAGLIVRYVVDGDRFVSVCQWKRFQKPRRPNTSNFPAPPFDSSDRVATCRDVSVLVPQEGSGGDGEWRGGVWGGAGPPQHDPQVPVDNDVALKATLLAERAASGALRAL